METVRFTSIVQQAGNPEPYTLWLPPGKDPEFQRALKAHRMMTVHQGDSGTAADFGEVGYAEGTRGSFLLFPKSLKRYEGKRVVGIKYDLLEQVPPAEPAKPSRAKAPAKAEAKRESRAPAKPRKHTPEPPKVFEPLRVFSPAKETVTAEPAPSVKAPKRVPEKEAMQGLRELSAAVRKAMKKLEQGNAVAAFQLLQKAVGSP